jgi:hypothetical protein
MLHAEPHCLHPCSLPIPALSILSRRIHLATHFHPRSLFSCFILTASERCDATTRLSAFPPRTTTSSTAPFTYGPPWHEAGPRTLSQGTRSSDARERTAAQCPSAAGTPAGRRLTAYGPRQPGGGTLDSCSLPQTVGTKVSTTKRKGVYVVHYFASHFHPSFSPTSRCLLMHIIVVYKKQHARGRTLWGKTTRWWNPCFLFSRAHDRHKAVVDGEKRMCRFLLC